MRGVRFLLLGRRSQEVQQYALEAEVHPLLYQNYLDKARSFRARVFVESGYDMDGINGAYTEDNLFWHLLAIETKSDTIIGCIRIRPFEFNTDQVDAAIILSLAGVDFPDQTEQILMVEAINNHISNVRQTASKLVYVGGLAVDKTVRGSTLSPILCTSMHSLGAITNWPFGLATTVVRKNTLGLDQRLGAFPVRLNNRELPASYCKVHQCPVRVMELRLSSFDKRLENYYTNQKMLFSRHKVLVRE